MLKYLPRSGMNFLLDIFDLSWTSHSFPSIWKTSSIIPIHKMGKLLNSPACFRPIFLIFCVSKLFERIILSHLLFFLKSNSIRSPRQAGFRSGRSSLDQILYFSQSILNQFNKPRRALERFSLQSTSQSFRLCLASLLALLVELNLSFLTGALVWFFKITKLVPYESVEMFRKHPFLAPYFSLSSSMIFLFFCLLSLASLFALTIWPIGPPQSLLRWRSDRELYFDWSAGLTTGVFLSIRENVRPLSSRSIPTKLLLLGSRLRFNSTPSFLGVTFDRTLSFSKHVSSLKAKFFLRLKALRCISASSWCLSKESISVLYEAFLRSFFTDASPGWFLFLSVTNFTKSERNLSLPTSFPISDLARLGVKPRLCRSSWRAFASTHPLMLPSTSSREVLFACSPFRPWNLPSFTVKSTLSS